MYVTKKKKKFESKYISAQQKIFLENLGEINISKGAHIKIALLQKISGITHKLILLKIKKK